MRSHVSLTCLGVFVLTLLTLNGTSEPPSLLEIGNRKQLFIDDYMIQSLSDARQVLNPATKSANNPVLRPDRPWEGRLSPISTVSMTRGRACSRCGTRPQINTRPSAGAES